MASLSNQGFLPRKVLISGFPVVAPGHLLPDGEGHPLGEVDAVERPQLHPAPPELLLHPGGEDGGGLPVASGQVPPHLLGAGAEDRMIEKKTFWPVLFTCIMAKWKVVLAVALASAPAPLPAAPREASRRRARGRSAPCSSGRCRLASCGGGLTHGGWQWSKVQKF